MVSSMSSSELTEKVLLEDIELLKENGDGYVKELIAKMQDGDELWEWSTDNFSWLMFRGQGGFVIVRGSELIDPIVTVWN